MKRGSYEQVYSRENEDSLQVSLFVRALFQYFQSQILMWKHHNSYHGILTTLILSAGTGCNSLFNPFLLFENVSKENGNHYLLLL